jgi:hypothetical protein
VQITSTNATTGVIKFNVAVGYAHLSTFPDGSNANPCGKARIYNLGSTASGYPWDIEHIYEGITIAPGASKDIKYMTLGGRHIKFVDCTIPAISPSVCGRFEMIGGVIAGTTVSEPDKLVQEMLFDGTVIESPSGVPFQSSSIDRVTFCNGKGAILCGAKHMLVQNWDAYFFTTGTAQNYGLMRNLKVENSILRSLPWKVKYNANTSINHIDGTYLSYSNGTFKILKANITNYFLGAVLGQVLWLGGGPGGRYVGDMANGIVTALTEDNTYVYIETTLPYTSLPSWANGYVALQYTTNEEYSNCYGCDQALALSEATRRGKRWWEYLYKMLAGKEPQTRNFDFGLMGNVTEMRINVIQAATISDANLRITSPYVYLVSSDGVTNVGPLVTQIDLRVAGVRAFTQTALTGKTATDSVTLKNVTQPTLLVGHTCCNFEWQYSFNPASYLPYQLPIVEVAITFDADHLRTLTGIVYG